MGNGQSTSSGNKVLAKVAQGDARAAQQVEDATAGFFNTSKGRRAALAVAAERGNCQLLVSVYEAAEQAKGSWQTRQDLLNTPASHGQTLMMKTCSKGHIDCLTYLLSKGADVMTTNSKGETCLHIAAKHAQTNCVVRLLSSRINTTSGAATRLADLTLREELQEVKYIDLHNLAGMTALHVATLNGSAATVQAILANGGSIDAEIRGNNLTPWLSRGSTALHIAAARGFHAVVDVLLAAQSPESGTDLRRVRNHRGLRPFQLARLNGHSSIARQLGDRATPRARRAARRRAASGGPAPGPEGLLATSPEALLTMLIQRAKLLLTLKAMATAPVIGKAPSITLLATCTDAQAQESKVEAAAAEVLECSEAWRKGSTASKPAGSILRLLSALDDLPAAAALNQTHALEGGPDKARSSGSYAAAAMVQAALNAMASSASADPVEASSVSLTPTTPLAAAVIIQAALRTLSGGKRRGGSRRPRRGSAVTPDTPQGGPSSLPSSPQAPRGASDSQRSLQGNPATPARLHSPPPEPNTALSGFAHTHGRSLQQHPAGPPTPRTPSTPRASTPRTPPGIPKELGRTPFRPERMHEPQPAQASDRSVSGQRQRDASSRVEPQSVPATPEIPRNSSGNQDDGPDFAAVRQQLPAQRPIAHPLRAASSKLLILPSAEDIDALCDMITPDMASAVDPSLQAVSQMPEMQDSISQTHAPSGQPPCSSRTQSSAMLELPLPSSSGTQSSAMPESSLPQRSRLHVKLGKGNPLFSANSGRQIPGAGQSEVPELSLRASSFRGQSECSSSAYDEGTSSGLQHSVSNEERIMHDLLEEGADSAFFNHCEPSSVDEQEVNANTVLNTRDLHGILGQHGYKLPGPGTSPRDDDGASDGDADGDDEDDAEDDSDDGDEDASGSFKVSAGELYKQAAQAQRKDMSEEDEGLCSICMDRPLEAQIAGCEHEMCLQCAYQMCARGLASPLCPFCRGPINTFKPVASHNHAHI